MTDRLSDPVPIGTRLMESQGFAGLFREGMALIEETAAYLDGPGRIEVRALPRFASLTYATESLRLTTRLMQIAAWLLLQRAVNEGDLDPAEARDDKRRIALQPLRAGPGFDDLPDRIKDLIERSTRLQERVVGLDAALYVERNPVARRIATLEAAFHPDAEMPVGISCAKRP